MKQRLLVIVLLLLLLLVSCKAFNYCILKELFVSKETVQKMMDDIYGKHEPVESFRVCSETEKRLMTSSRIAEECDTEETFQNFPKCSEIHKSAREQVRETGQCVEGFAPDICCTTQMILEGAEIGKDCKEPCAGFVDYSPFKESFQPTVPEIDVAKLRDSKKRYIF